MSTPTLPALDAVCGCGRRRSSHYADAGRLRGPDCPDYHEQCDPTCKHPVWRGLVTAPTPIQLAPRGPAPNPDDRPVPAAEVPARLRQEPLPPDMTAVPAPEPSARTLDALDPVCRCRHRRGRHAQNGSATPCRRCGCRDFTTEVPHAPATQPATAASAAARPAGPPAPGEGRPVDRPAARPAGRVGAGDGLKTPRRQDPRPADDRALVTPAAVGEDDADEEVTAAVGATAAVIGLRGPSWPILVRLRAERKRQGLTQTDVAIRVGVTDAYVSQLERGRSRASLEVIAALADALGHDIDIRLVDRDAPVAPPADPLDAALYCAARWYCRSCHDWPLDPGACRVCHAPLQPVYLATIPREITP
jgi:transcriptional regulator with XRE-family HTH domain